MIAPVLLSLAFPQFSTLGKTGVTFSTTTTSFSDTTNIGTLEVRSSLARLRAPPGSEWPHGWLLA